MGAKFFQPCPWLLQVLLYGRFHLGFDRLVLVNAGSTLAVLLFVPLLPALLLNPREGAVVTNA